MNASTLRFLLSPAGQTLLAEAAALRSTEATWLADLTYLRKRYPAEQVSAAMETIRLRGRAGAKFARADRMYFTAPALEQASGEGIATYRARRYQAVGAERVADLGCGIGGDSLALAAGALVLGLDLDKVRLTMAWANCSAYDRGNQFQPVLSDLREWLPQGVDALFFDPGRRREDGRRIHSVSRYRPPLEIIHRWLPRVPHMAAKVSPAVDYEELSPGAEIEFISERGTVKEGVLWFGDLRTSAGRRATLLPGEETLTDDPTPPIPVGLPSAYLYEPDGAVIRAHLVEQLAGRLGAAKVDRDIAYLTADELVETPFARAFALEDHLPFNLKQLRAYLRARNVGRAVVKKRGSPLGPDELIRRLKLRGDEERVLFLTRVEGRPSVLVGRQVAT